MKVCNICKEEKPLTEFPKNRTKKDGYSLRCKECNRKVVKKHYYKNKKLYLKKNKRYIQRKREWWNDYKLNLKCNKCSEDHISCLEFHHKNPELKEANISSVILTWSKERLMNEVKKCEVLCSNCHRKEHYSIKNMMRCACNQETE